MTLTTTPLHDAETIRQQRNLTKSQKRTNTETKEGVLVNNFIVPTAHLILTILAIRL